MIRKLSITLLLALFAMSSQAQTTTSTDQLLKKHEITAGLGLVSDIQLVTLIGDVGATIVTGGYFVKPGSYSAFAPFATYRYWFNKRIALGGSFLIDFNSVMLKKEVHGTFEEHTRIYPTITAEFVVNYVYRPVWQLYGLIGAGATIAIVSNSDFPSLGFFNMHISPLGLRVGKDIGGFIEFGYGYKGIINAGVSVRL
ncbi:MAG: hypothetical protein LBO06_05220 [Bacteroidales bacterium]|jgi:hypothetical protein|nr:hypothetical protein [Bacteroidales bacterium]